MVIFILCTSICMLREYTEFVRGLRYFLSKQYTAYKPCPLVGGFGGMLHKEFFLKMV